MSSYGTIEIVCGELNSERKDVSTILEDFLKDGWKMDMDNEISYCLDANSYDWNFVSSTEIDDILNKLKKELIKGAEIGVSVLYQDLPYGWHLQIKSDLSVFTFVSEIWERKCIENMNVTDFTFHLNYILPSFSRLNLEVIDVTCSWVR